MKKVLFAASEVFPLAKTGGLADVAHALPRALRKLGLDVKITMPAYRGTRARLERPQLITDLAIRGQRFSVWEGRLPETDVEVRLLECAALYDREGDPYRDGSGEPWTDNARRFGYFCEAVARLATAPGVTWRPDVIHCNDWQTGLIPAWLLTQPKPPQTVFTVHNLAFQGNYGRDAFEQLGLPAHLWSIEGVEFHGQLSFMKAGLVYADVITTVSPTYAREIETPEFGFGMEGVLGVRSSGLHGILNGIDTEHWDPASDPHLVQTYSAATVTGGKRANKAALQKELHLAADPGIPVIAVIGRLGHQKGSDLVLTVLPELLQDRCQLVLLGSGERDLESAFRDAARRMAGQMAARIAHDESLAHRIIAAADVFLMPSRFEPCGLTQMYSQRYGTIPVVRRIGGLADTVTGASRDALASGAATGITFERAEVGDLLNAARRALDLLRNHPAAWSAMQDAGMRRDFSWGRAASAYAGLYRGD